ncbi:SGNH/GDSL hydrolase family protein [Arsenicibacter rosenii]|uniref:GDSL family lipase n=1 Tax=Arsenicibacter rosenii TaxID=1750698 RepID=A0A1S2VRX4_9BACT|nr:SGNH/GDSL hydrolase family protein [Arsenicibacter rosenii]OIN61065.1 GDSL family lipase [Arsenicibacter rosenii]
MKKLLCCIPVIALLFAFTHPDMTWLALGDSITYLNDHADETGNRVQKGYLTRVTDKLPYVHYVNKGYNGWTVIRIAESIDKLGLTKADVYSVFLGTNDWWGGKPLGRFTDYAQKTGNGTVYGAYRTIIDKLRSLNPAAPILLITPMQRVDFVYINNPKNNAYGSYKAKNGQTLEQVAAAVDSIGKHEHLPVIDLYHLKSLSHKKLVRFKRLKDPETGQYKNVRYPAFIDIPFDPATDEYPYPVESIGATYDGLHPSDKGNEIISREVVRVMKRF